jgi:hypothetical protein
MIKEKVESVVIRGRISKGKLKDTERDAKYELKIQQMNRKSTF